MFSKSKKAILTALVLSMAVSLATPKKAEAGIILSAAGLVNDFGRERSYARSLEGTGALFIVIGFVVGNADLIVLDTKTNEPAIAAKLAEKYSILADQPNVANKLATVINSQAGILFKSNPSAQVINTTVEASKVASIMDEAITTEDNAGQVAQIISDLST